LPHLDIEGISMTSKDDLRLRYRRERQERYVPHSFENLLDAPEIARAHTIASYYSYGSEPDTSALNRALIHAGKNLLLPRIDGEILQWVTWNGDEEQLKKNKNFSEPTSDATPDLASIDVVIVPALRIDREGFRLGQGGGYYDRALPHLRAWSIGLIHPDELSGTPLPHDEWDIPLHAAATPDLIFRFK
jgi:5-formyltetrahydrofolate cyclo-ligase